MPGAAAPNGAGGPLLLLKLVSLKNICFLLSLLLYVVLTLLPPCSDQLEELRASECALRVRVKSLTSELALLRRGLDNLSVYYIFSFLLFHSFTYNMN